MTQASPAAQPHRLFQAFRATVFLLLWIAVAAFAQPAAAAPPNLQFGPADGSNFPLNAGLPFNQNFVPNGGAWPYTFSLDPTSGPLPDGLSLSASGLLSGTLLEPGNYSVKIRLTDGDAEYVVQSYTFQIAAGPVVIVSPATLAQATVGTPYSQTVTVVGGTGTKSFQASGLPGGLTMQANGTLSGTPTEAGSFPIVVTATDTLNVSDMKNYTLVVNNPPPPTVSAITPAEKLVTANMFYATLTGTNLSTVTNVIVGGIWVHLNQIEIVSDTTIKFLTPSNLPGTHDVIVKTAGGDVTLPQAFTVKVPPSAASIVQQPVDKTYAGSDVTFAVVASGAESYQWEVKVSGGWWSTDGRIGLSGHKTAALTVAGMDASFWFGFQFRVRIQGAAGTSEVISSAVTLRDPNAPVSDDATLSALTFSAGTIEPAFSPETHDYVVTVPHETTQISVTATTAHAGASLSIRDTSVVSGAPFGPISLNVGNNKVGIMVLAEDRMADAYYYVRVNREEAPLQPGTVSLSPASGQTLAAGTVGKAYAGATIAASGGTAPYGYAVTAGKLPKGLSLDAATGEIAGTPGKAGSYGFTVTATDAVAVAGSASYTIEVAGDVKGTLAFTPPAGRLETTMAGEPYSLTVKASGGVAPWSWSLKSGTLPEGLVLDKATGLLSGTIAADAEGDYRFTLAAKDGAGLTGAVGYRLKVGPRKVTVADRQVEVPEGSAPTDVRLDSGATGGPFSSGALAFVEPANAGTATITWGDYAQAGPPSGPVGWYLKFVPDPAYSGTVRVGFRLTSALGVSNTGTVTYKLVHDAAKVAAEIDALVHGFVQTRQSLLLSSIKVPGLLERRQAAAATDPVTTRLAPSGDGMTLGFATSLAQIEAARDNAGGTSAADPSPFNIWIDGTVLVHNREQNDSRWGHFGMVSLGADYLVAEKALVGLSFHFDRMSDPTKNDAELTGDGWLAGPYASFEIGKGVFWNASLLYGGSANDIDTRFWDGSFDTTRWMADTSITGRWMLDEVTTLTPTLRAVYFNEEVDDYTVGNGAGGTVALPGFTEEQFRVSLGAEIARSFTLENDAVLTPKLGVTGGFAGLDGTGAFGSVTAGLALQTADEWVIDAGLLFNILEEGAKSAGAKVGVSRRF